MTDDKPESFVSRWSRRKLAAAREVTATSPAPPASVSPAPATAPEAAAATPVPAAAPELPPVESLTFESDFTPFMHPNVEVATRQAALRKLLRDARFNAMDGLDVYIDDYTKPAPLAPDVARRLADALFTPTRVNEHGYVEDVPPEERITAQPAERIAAQPADRIAPPATPPAAAPMQVTPDETAAPASSHEPAGGPLPRGEA